MANDVFPGAVLRQLVEWGYPQRSLRPTPPATKAFSVVHITGNSRLPSADNEIGWRLNDPGLQNSATFFVNRDGSIRQALGDPLHMDPWANGDVRSPDTRNPRIASVVRDGVNANERTIVAIENVGYEPGHSITAAQEDANARIIAYYHRKAGVLCNRETIIGHYQLNSIARPNCPGVNKSVVDRIAIKAAAIANPAPLPPQEEDVPLPPPPPHFMEYFPATARVELVAGRQYNAFQFLGMGEDGKPILKRFDGITVPDQTRFFVMGRVHWVENATPGYLFSQFAYLPGEGLTPMVWWSREPLDEPKLVNAGAVATDCSDAIAKATAPLQAKINAARAALS